MTDAFAIPHSGLWIQNNFWIRLQPGEQFQQKLAVLSSPATGTAKPKLPSACCPFCLVLPRGGNTCLAPVGALPFLCTGKPSPN